MNLKKPKFWDYNRPNIYAYLLYPLTFLIKFINIFKSKPKIKSEKLKPFVLVIYIYWGDWKNFLKYQN